MNEISTRENEQIVAGIFRKCLDVRAAGKKLNASDQLVYEIEIMLQEVNSGASFEQYFRWASIEEISMIIGHLQTLGLSDVADIVLRALSIAFPGGLPRSASELDALTQWTPDQEKQLRAIAEALIHFNGVITNALAEFCHRNPSRQ
jgi:hypothetical protein